MAVPKSKVLLSNSEKNSSAPILPEIKSIVITPGEAVKIKEVPCCNDFVALMQFRIQSGIELGDSGLKHEGIVVGVGPGVVGPNGTRCPSQLMIGDVVAFFGNPVLVLKPDRGVYQGQNIVFYSERAMLCKLPQIPFQIVAGSESA